MTTTVEFDSATFADALTKAARVAPTKGASFDKAAGFVFEVPETGPVILRATDLETTYTQRLNTVSRTGDPVTWRIPSILLAGMVTALPLGEGRTVKLIDKNDSWIVVVSGDVKAKFAMLNPDLYPKIEDVVTDDPANPMSPAQEFASKVAQVAWSTKKDVSALSGVLVDGASLWACNGYTMPWVPCTAPLDRPVVVPLLTLAGLLRNATDVRIRATASRLELALDAETTATCRLLEDPYPDVKALAPGDDVPRAEATFGRQEFLDSVNRMLVLVKTERLPRMKLTFNGTSDVLTLDLEVPEIGRMQDSIPAPNTLADGETFYVHLSPTMIRDAIDGSNMRRVTFKFGRTDDPDERLRPCLIMDEDEYRCVIMPIHDDSGDE